jgi:hypothetical protein
MFTPGRLYRVLREGEHGYSCGSTQCAVEDDGGNIRILGRNPIRAADSDGAYDFVTKNDHYGVVRRAFFQPFPVTPV